MSIRFILVNPSRSENVGAVARAMKTMGFHDLYIVASSAHKSPDAHKVAHNSQDILEKAHNVDSLTSALEGVDLAIATTARHRAEFRTPIAIRKLRALVSTELQSSKTIAVVFGCEASGLSNDQLALCDITTTIPLATTHPSLNLAQAVMIFAYELSQIHENKTKTRDEKRVPSLKIFQNEVDEFLQFVDMTPKERIYKLVRERLCSVTGEDRRLALFVKNRIKKKLTSKNEDHL